MSESTGLYFRLPKWLKIKITMFASAQDENTSEYIKEAVRQRMERETNKKSVYTNQQEKHALD